MAKLWIVTRKDGVILRLTDHDAPLTYLGNTFVPTGGASQSARQRKADFGQDNAELLGVISSSAITEVDLLAGRYFGATIREIDVDWRFPFAGALSEKIYEISETTFDGVSWRAQVAGLVHRLKQQVGRVYSRLCDHDLGDSVCRVNMAPLTLTSKTVSAIVTQRTKFNTNLTQANGWFDDGLLTWTAGANSGVSCPVKAYLNASGAVELQLETPFDITTSDVFTIKPGCDKRAVTCRDKFDNIENHGGFPMMQGTDRLYATPNSKT